MSRYLIPYTFYDLAQVIAAGRPLTPEEATDLIRHGLKKPTDVSDADLTLARATLAHAWAKPLGLALVRDGWWRMTRGSRPPDVPEALPGDRVDFWSRTLWIRKGRPVAYVSQPRDMSDELRKDMDVYALCFNLEYVVFDKPGWSDPDRSLFVLWQPRGDWDSILPAMKDVPRIKLPPEPDPNAPIFVPEE